MVYYAGLILLISLFAFLGRLAENEKLAKKVFFILTALVTILFQGLRSFSVGTDLAAYIPALSAIGESPAWEYDNFEVGYVILNKIIYYLGGNGRTLLFVVSVMVQVPIFLTIYRNTETPFLGVLIYFAFGNFFMTFSGLRQSIAMALCFYSYDSIKRKKIIKFCITVIIAALFHTSAIICIILYPLYYIKLDKRFLPLTLAIIGFLFIFRREIILYGGYLYYGHTVELTETNSYTMFALYLALYLISFFFTDGTNEFMGLRNFIFYLTCIYVFASVHDYVARLGFPLTLYLSIFVPKVVDSVSPLKTDRTILRVCSCAICLICFFFFCGALDTLPFSFL